MKVLIVLLPLVASCLAGEASYSPAPGTQKGLLVLPKPALGGGSSSYTQGQYVTKNNYNQQQAPEILSPKFAEKRGVYFVEVPQERIQALQGYRQQQASQNFQNSAQYNQEDSTPVNVRYLPLEDTFNAPSQYRQEQTAEVPVVRYLPVPLTEEYRRAEETTEQQVLLQYSEVQPIRGPVYAYSPQSITRVLRYAPKY